MKIVIKETRRPGFLQITTLGERWYRRKSDSRDFASNTWICSYVPMDDYLIDYIAKKGTEQAKEDRAEKGRRGSRIHAAIEVLVLNPDTGIAINDVFPDGDGGEPRELDPDEYAAVMSFRDWWLDYKDSGIVEVLGVEMDYYNEGLGYACTADLVCEVVTPKGRFLDVIDYKTGQSIHLEHQLQLEGITHTDEILALAAERKLTVRKFNLQVGYRKNKAGFKFTEHTKDRWNLYLAAREFWLEDNAGKSPREVEYPVKITLKKEDGK